MKNEKACSGEGTAQTMPKAGAAQAAAKTAVRRVAEMVLAEHMRTCVVEEVRAGNDEVIDEVMALMRRFSK